MEKISIIIPCYNGEKTVRRCLDSVCRQSYENFEVLFVDDGSKDESKQIVREYTERDSRFKLIETSNRGVSAARNTGIGLAQGEYIQFLDADDEMLPEMLETLLRAINESNADIAVCNFMGNPLFLAYFDDAVFDLGVESELLEYYQETFCMLPPWNKLFRREVITVGFDEQVHFAEDELFNLSVMANARRIACVNKPLYFYHFAPADEQIKDDGVSAIKKSCLNKIIEATDKNCKNSVWYKGAELIPKRRAILENASDNSSMSFSHVDDLLYTRVFDFFFWEMSAFAYMNTDRRVIYNEVYNVLREPEFIRSVEVQKKYGVQFVKYDAAMLRPISRQFVDACLYSYNDIRENHPELKFYDVFVMIFLFLFCRPAERLCLEYNRLYKTMRQLYENSSEEANYINKLTCANRFAAKVTTA